jgi:hypothetical protein
VGKSKVNQRELEGIMENLEFELRCSVNPLPTHLWLRLARHKWVPFAIVVVLLLIFLFFKKDILQLLQ